MRLKEKILQDTPYIPVYKFILNRGVQEALLLSFLIDADSFAYVRLTEDIDYFKCTDTFIQSQIDLSSPTIKKYLDQLVNEGFVYIRVLRNEGTSQRFIKLNQKKLTDEYEKFNHKKDEKNIENTTTILTTI